MATMIRARLSLLFWISTAALKPFGMQAVVDPVEDQEEEDGEAETKIAADHGAEPGHAAASATGVVMFNALATIACSVISLPSSTRTIRPS